MEVGVGVDVDAVVGGPDELADFGVEVSAGVLPPDRLPGGLVGVDVEEWSPFVEGGGVDGGDGEAGYVGHGCSFSKVGWREGRLGVVERVSRNHQVGWFVRTATVVSEDVPCVLHGEQDSNTLPPSKII